MMDFLQHDSTLIRYMPIELGLNKHAQKQCNGIFILEVTIDQRFATHQATMARHPARRAQRWPSRLCNAQTSFLQVVEIGALSYENIEFDRSCVLQPAND